MSERFTQVYACHSMKHITQVHLKESLSPICRTSWDVARFARTIQWFFFFRRRGIGAILDYVAEADIDQDNIESKPNIVKGDAVSSMDVSSVLETTNIDDVAKEEVPFMLNRTMLDRREGALAKTYFYEGEAGE